MKTEPLISLRRIANGPSVKPTGEARPLDGVRVLDLTRVLAGPTSTKALASHGAQVLRINRKDLADSGFFDLDTGLGKRSAYLDLRVDQDRSIMAELLQTCDVLVQAYRPGALAALGYSSDKLSGRFPGMIMVNLCAWGFSGPWRARRGYDTVVQAANGLAWRPDNAKPRFLPVAAQDYLAGYLMAFGAMAALWKRTQEGGSWEVNVSLAGVGEWFRSQGMLAESDIVSLPDEISAATLDAILGQSDSVAGRLSHLRAMPQMSLTPARWNQPAVPMGHHPPTWV